MGLLTCPLARDHIGIPSSRITATIVDSTRTGQGNPECRCFAWEFSNVGRLCGRLPKRGPVGEGRNHAAPD